jgi:restriction system protein
MANPQLDQFTSALFWKIVPWLIVAGAVGTLAGSVVKWLERRATEIGRKRRASRDGTQATSAPDLNFDLEDAPHCPACNGPMVKRTARKGVNAGQQFWGCERYPQCRGTRPI